MSLDADAIVAVIGAGAMGGGIAQVAAAAGHRVLLYDAVAEAPARAVERMDKGLARQVDRGRLDAGGKEAIIARVSTCDELSQVGGADLVIEAIIEDLDAKKALFTQLEATCKDTAIFATNSSSISITAIASVLTSPGRFLGMHFFNPAPVMKLVEVISGLATDPDIAESVFSTASNWGKRPVHALSTPGFIVNRVARPFYAEALRILQEGAADVATIDAIMKQAGGFRMGPFELMDLIGNDVNYAVTQSVFAAFYNDPRYSPSLIQKELNDAGRLGRKSDYGYYDYSDDAEPSEPATAARAAAPARICYGDATDPTRSVIEALESAGLSIEHDARLPINTLSLDDSMRLRLTDGRSATQLAHDSEYDDIALFDLTLDYTSAARVAVTQADQSTLPLDSVAGLFQSLGKSVSVIDDIPGMIIMRTVCMLANEGAEAVNHGICSVESVDEAMQAGLNYPRGPLAWADQIGLDHVRQVLDHLHDCYREPRYRASSFLRRKCYAGAAFYD